MTNSWPEVERQPDAEPPLPAQRKDAQCCAGQPWRCSQVHRRHAVLLPSSLLRPLLPGPLPPAARPDAAAPPPASTMSLALLHPGLLQRELFRLLPTRQWLGMAAAAAPPAHAADSAAPRGTSLRAAHCFAASSSCRGAE